MKPVLRVLVFLCLLNHALPAQSSFLNLSVNDGLPQSQVWCLAEDAFGYLWCGTQGGGLGRFDGKNFIKYDQRKGLKSNFIQCLYAAPDHRLWVGSSAGLQYLREDSIHDIPNIDRQVNVMQPFEHDLWIGTSKGLFVAKKTGNNVQRWNIHPAVDADRIWSLLAHKGKLWIGTEKGLWCYDPQKGTTKHPDKWSNFAITALAADHLGRIWVSIGGVGVNVLTEGTDQNTFEIRQPGMEWINHLSTDPAGTMWISTSSKGIFLVEESSGKISNISEKNGLPHPHVRQVLADQNGQMWIATSGGGLCRQLGQAFKHFGAAQGLGGTRIYALCEDRFGKIWFSASQQGLFSSDSTGIHAYTQDSGQLKDVKIKSIAQDHLGRLWIGTDGRGLWNMDSSGVRRITNLHGDRVQSIVVAPDGQIWVATADRGIARLQVTNGIGIQHFGASEGLKESVMTMIWDPSGRICFGTQSGAVGFVRNGKLEPLIRNGLDGTPIRCMAADAHGRIWVGTRGSGIYYMEFSPSASFKKLEAALRSQNIYSLVFDTQGQLWIGSENGVDCLTFNSADVTDFGLQHFGKSEGFLGIENCQEASLCDHLGRLWFGTINGLEQYVPGESSNPFNPPHIHFSEIKLFYTNLLETAYAKWFDPLRIAAGWTLPYHKNSLTFEYKGVDLLRPDAIRYCWRLDGGQQNGWSDLTEYPSIHLANLAPGQYVFKVQATSDGGETFSNALSAPFTISKPFWELWPFRLGLVLSLACLGWWLARRWVNRIKAQEKERRKQLEIQNHLLQLEQKALQLQMNPHFIFNALNGIQSLVFAQQPEAARQQIGYFAQLMRSILHNSRKSVISLQEEVETLGQYLRIEQCIQPKPFDFQVELPPDADPEEIGLPPMLLQPFVENAVLHGVSHQSEKGIIDIRFSLQEDVLTCSIRDNGVGREKAAKLRMERQPGHQSVSVEVNRERLEAIREGRAYKVLEYLDIKDTEGRICGTEVILRIRVERGV